MRATVDVEHFVLSIYFGFYKSSKLFRFTLTTSSQAYASWYAYSAYLNAPSDYLAFPNLIKIDGVLIFFISGAACLNIFKFKYKEADF
jgi:hypothetical protein